MPAPVNSASLLEVGPAGSTADHSANPTFLYDLTVRTGGATAGKNDVGIKINSNNVVADQIWLWRADHGAGAAWTDQPDEERPGRQRQQRDHLRPVQRAPRAVPDALERQRRPRVLLPVRDAVRRARPVVLDERHDQRLRVVQGRRHGDQPRGLGRGRVLPTSATRP